MASEFEPRMHEAEEAVEAALERLVDAVAHAASVGPSVAGLPAAAVVTHYSAELSRRVMRRLELAAAPPVDSELFATRGRAGR